MGVNHAYLWLVNICDAIPRSMLLHLLATGYFQIFATHLKVQSEKRDPLYHFPLNVTGEQKQLVRLTQVVFKLVYECFTQLWIPDHRFNLHVMGVHVNALRF